jgi:hypothetical protein
MVKRDGGDWYVFAVAMRDGSTRATFRLTGAGQEGTVEVLGESRTIDAAKGSFSDEFRPWDVHLYKLASSVN